MIDILPYIRPSHRGDTTLALDDAVKDALPKGQSIYFPAGWWVFRTRPKPIGGGVTIRGESGWTTAHTGTCFNVAYDEANDEAGFLTWDGTDKGPYTDPAKHGYRGTGGGIRDLTIYKYGSYRGGCAILVKPANHTNFRSGMWTLSNVSIISENGGLFDRILLCDGSNIPPKYAGGMGLRAINIHHLFASGAAVCNVELRNAVHVHWSGGQVQQATAPTLSPAAVRITGTDTQDIIISTTIYGLLHLNQCKSFIINCLAIDVDIDANVSGGILNVMQCRRLTDNSAGKVKITRV